MVALFSRDVLKANCRKGNERGFPDAKDRDSRQRVLNMIRTIDRDAAKRLLHNQADPLNAFFSQYMRCVSRGACLDNSQAPHEWSADTARPRD